LQEIRTFLGVCPQHDILFPELTVLQHLQMYASFKGVEKKNVDFEAKKMIAEVGLLEKINAKSSTLSGFNIIIIIIIILSVIIIFFIFVAIIIIFIIIIINIIIIVIIIIINCCCGFVFVD
jgi:hypothetical protein